MSLKPLQTGVSPLGQFDCLDADLTTVTGGEVMVFGSVAAASDVSASDSVDGYVSSTLRTVVKLADANPTGKVMLADDGIAGYGTLFGSVVGGTVGTQTSGAVLGPHTATASGKVTCWAGEGLYRISVSSMGADVVPGAAGYVPGARLGAIAGGKLSLTASAKCATFVQFTTDGALVTTPNHLVGTFNPPNGLLSQSDKVLPFADVYFDGLSA